MANPITVTVTDANGLTATFTAFADVLNPPTLTVTVVPQAAVAGTPRTVTAVAAGAGPFTYTCNGVSIASPTTAVFTVVV